MDKITYLAELAEGLARWVPERERQNILRYYAEYFEEAGPEREAEVVAELGDPWALSCRLAVEGGFVTQEQASSWTPKKRRVWPWVLAGCLVAVVALAGMAFKTLIGFGQMVWRDNGVIFRGGAVTEVEVATPYVSYGPLSSDEIAIYEGGTGYVFGDSIEAFDRIDAEISLGNITVVAGDDYTLSIEQNAVLGGYGLSWEVKGGTLKLKDDGAVEHVMVNDWDDLKNLFGVNQRAMNVTITVPEGAPLDKVSVKTGLGDVLMWGVFTQKMEAETGLGNINCFDCQQVKKLDLETGMGDVVLSLDEPYSGVDIDLESGMGNVEANLGGSERDWEYEIKTSMGTVTVNGAGRSDRGMEQKGNYPYKLEAESGMGDVNVYFQDD